MEGRCRLHNVDRGSCFSERLEEGGELSLGAGVGQRADDHIRMQRLLWVERIASE